MFCMTGQEKCAPGCTCGKHTRSGGRGGVRAKCEPGCTCKKHTRSKVVDWNDPEARKAYNRQKAKEAYAADPEKFKSRTRKDHMRAFYGITPERMAEMIEEQNGCCYLCDEPLGVHGQRGIYVDHDHDCCRGERSCGTCVRGLTCHQCNTGIGFFGDSPERMRRVADRLEMANRRLRDPRPLAVEQLAFPLDEEGGLR
jgi:Recombination endonuclease VII